MTIRLLALIALLTTVLLVSTGTAFGDTASDMSAELAESALPGLSVTVGTPPVATAADVAAFNADPASTPPTLTPEAMLSPDPAAPLPVATVRFGKSSVTRFPGLIYVPGISGYIAVEDAEFPIWRMAIMAALRKRVASGTQLAGAAMQPQFPHRPGGTEPDMWVAAPIASEYPAAAAPRTRTADDVRTAIVLDLPAYAKAAEVRVLDRARMGRVVDVRLSLPAITAGLHVAELAARLQELHATLNQTGAGIAVTQLHVTDAVGGGPLFTAAGDPDWGQFYSWAAPVVRAYSRTSTPAAEDAAAAASNSVGAATGLPAP